MFHSLRTVKNRTVELLQGFVYFFVPNRVIAQLPGYALRHFYYRRVCRLRIGERSSIHHGVYITGRKIEIGDHSTVGRHSYLDGRGGLTIGSCVSISPDVHLITAQHDMNDPDFANVLAPIVIEDYVWIGSRATVLPGVRIGRG
ncbi:MAG: acyltransferase, partial [Armatimonadetes bacterium]|nr:acyltransferase [Armatimonadota bacterium]